MKTKLASLSIALSAAALASGAFAGTIDLTDTGSYTAGTSQASGAVDGVSWTLDPVPNSGKLTYTPFDGGSCLAPLACENDGVGIRFSGDKDEVDFPVETLVMKFGKTISVVGVYVLDLFGSETVDILDDANNLVGTITAMSGAFDNSTGGFSFLTFASKVTTTSLTFRPGRLNDSEGGATKPNFALAAVKIAAVPVPASGLLLVGAMAGLGALRRRKSA